MQTVRDVTYQLLRQAGLTTVFGNPGSTEETFLKNFPADFRYVLALQEASVIAMADGFAQAAGRPALVNVHTGAGLGNAMGNLITAFLNKTPLIVTAGQQTREMLLMEPWLTNVEATMLPRPWAKWAYEPVRAEDVPAAFMRAIATALQPPAGPVFLSLPLDDWGKPCAGPAVLRTVSRRFAPDHARLAEFAKALSEASSPVLIFGGAIGRGNGWKEAVALAEALVSPVWAAPVCERTPFPENHPLYCGALPFAIGPLCQKLEGHDVALAVGAPVFRYYPYVPGRYLPEGMRLLHISDDPSETARAPVGDSLLGDAVLSAGALADLLGKRKPGTAKVREKAAHRVAPHPANPAKGPDDGLLTAAQVFEALNAIRPANAILVEESPSNHADLHKCWPITEPATYFAAASGGLGFGLPGSVGIALAERESGRNRPVIAIIGDGSFQYSVQSLWTAAQHRLPILFIVLRNKEYAILKSFAVLEDTPNVPGLDLPGLDIVSIAKGFGCDAARLDDSGAIKSAAAKALNKPEPTVLEIPISPYVPPLI
ncbi:MAG: benzoylformate decarboxylase [Rhodomicrobium sp.]